MSRPSILRPSRAVGASFPIRRVDFDFSKTPKYIYDDNAFESCVWLVIQALFPPGEQFFIDAVRAVRHRVDDPQLQRDIVAFMGQEALHGRAHRQANEQMQRHGLGVQATERRAKVVLKLIERWHTPMQRLAMTAGAEHLTATLARFMLRHPDYLAGFREPEVRRLIMWHALEEREHRAVAFDLFKRAGGGELTRVTMFPWLIALLLPLIIAEVTRMLVTSGGLADRPALLRGARSLFGRRGLFARITPWLRDYFRRDFHPNDDDQSALEAEWRRELALAP